MPLEDNLFAADVFLAMRLCVILVSLALIPVLFYLLLGGHATCTVGPAGPAGLAGWSEDVLGRNHLKVSCCESNPHTFFPQCL